MTEKKRVRRTYGAHRPTKLEREVLACVPDTWLDSLLSGPKAIPMPAGCQDIQRLCNEIRSRITVAFRRNTW